MIEYIQIARYLLRSIVVLGMADYVEVIDSDIRTSFSEKDLKKCNA